MSRVLARLARVALATVLLAAWQVSLQHPIEHRDASGGFAHGGAPNDHSLACDLLAALGACAPSSPAAAPLAASVDTPARFAPTLNPKPSPRAAYRALAPPARS
ncbi:MAG TPA: hypothetical protein VIS77_05905 [Burkholderiales bacterium]